MNRFFPFAGFNEEEEFGGALFVFGFVGLMFVARIVARVAVVVVRTSVGGVGVCICIASIVSATTRGDGRMIIMN